MYICIHAMEKTREKRLENWRLCWARHTSVLLDLSSVSPISCPNPCFLCIYGTTVPSESEQEIWFAENSMAEQDFRKPLRGSTQTSGTTRPEDSKKTRDCNYTHTSPIMGSLEWDKGLWSYGMSCHCSGSQCHRSRTTPLYPRPPVRWVWLRLITFVHSVLPFAAWGRAE